MWLHHKTTIMAYLKRFMANLGTFTQSRTSVTRFVSEQIVDSVEMV